MATMPLESRERDGAAELLQLGLAARQVCAPGETVCGDALSIRVSAEIVELAVADGLGHGPEAAVAAQAFTRAVREHGDGPLPELFSVADARLAETRGAAAAVLRVHRRTGELEFAGVGNVDVRFSGTRDFHPTSLPGIVGRPRHQVRTFLGFANRGATFVLFSDGLVGTFEIVRQASLAPDALVAALFETHLIGRDDATCVAYRFGGEA